VNVSAAGANKEEGGNMIKLFKSRKLMTVLMFLSTVALGTVMAHAQFVSNGVKADIPFAFTVEHTTLPAGNYTIYRTGDTGSMLDLRNPDKDVNVVLMTEANRVLDNVKKPELVFDKIANRDFLREVRTSDTVFTLMKSPLEVKLENQGEKAMSHRVSCSSMKNTTTSAKASSY
jgi:hypothetical protein